MRTISIFLAAAFLAAAPSSNRPSARSARPPVRKGEKLIYRVRFAGMAAGETVLSVDGETDRGGTPAWRVSLRARSNRFASMFKSIDDRAASVIDKRSLHSLGFRADKHEGGKRKSETIVPDYDAMTATTRRLRPGRSTKERRFEIPGPIQDPVSWIYGLRVVDFSKRGEDTPRLVVATTRGTVPLKLEVVGSDRLRIPGHGKLRALRVKVTGGGEALMGKDGDLTMWLDRETLVPLRIIVKTGKVSAGMYLTRTSRSPLD